MIVGDSIFITRSTFDGSVNFGTVETKKNFEAQNTTFSKNKVVAEFYNLKVGNSVLLGDASFFGGVDFYGASIGMDIAAAQTKFLSKDLITNFNNITVGNEINFDRSIFKSDLFLKNATAKTLHIVGKAENGEASRGNIRKLYLCSATLENELTITHCNISDMEATNMKSKMLSIIDDVSIADKLDLTNSKFTTLNLINVRFPEQKNSGEEKIFLDNCIYESIYLENKNVKDDWITSLDLMDSSRFNYKNYKQLADTYEKSGFSDRATEVIMNGEKRYQESMKSWKKYPYLFFWGMCTKYGRDPYRPLLICLFFVAIGSCIFTPKFLDLRVREKWGWLEIGRMRIIASYTLSLFLSLDLFIPGRPLGLSDKWLTSKAGFWRLLYYKIHRLSGWIFISLTLAATYAKFK